MNTTPNVPRIPPMAADGSTPTRRNMLPVIGTGQWSEAGEQAAWLLSRGSTLVCMGPEPSAMVASSNYNLAFKCLPHEQNTMRLWTVSLAADADGAIGEIQSLDGAITYAPFVVPKLPVDMPGHTSRIVTFCTDNADDTVDGNGHSEFGVRIAMDAASPGDAFITSIQCSELPIPYVEPDDFPSGGPYKFPALQTLRTGEPIFDDESESNRSTALAGVQRATKAAITDARRAVLFCCAKHPGYATFSGTYGDVFETPVPVLARRRYITDVAASRTIKVWVLATGDGNVRITAASGDTVTLTYAAVSYEWQVADLVIDAEDLSNLATDGGLQSATRDTVRVESRTTSVLLTVRVVMGGEVD